MTAMVLQNIYLSNIEVGVGVNPTIHGNQEKLDLNSDLEFDSDFDSDFAFLKVLVCKNGFMIAHFLFKLPKGVSTAIDNGSPGQANKKRG